MRFSAGSVLSTYRVQLRGPGNAGCTFADVENLLGYLDCLGVSHVYLSPITTSVRGSAHGYDVTDPTTVAAELGGADGLARLSAAARSRGMGLVVDIVPNHVGVGQPEQNPWWWDVLTHGRSSRYARFFDIDWDLGDGRVVLPLLDSDDDAAVVLPHDRRHYRLVSWRSGLCGYRRFLSVSSLAALRQEDRAVFDTCHAEVGRWFAAGLIDGVRVDHVDGLADPPGYLAWLRELVGPSAWIVIEKALAADEALEPTLPVAGTTGYDALREIGGLFVDPAGAAGLTALAESAGGASLRDLKAGAATGPLASELHRLRRCIAAATGIDHPRLEDALVALLGRIDVYRCDYPGLSAVLPAALAETGAAAPELAPALQLISATIAAGSAAATRLQQLCVAVTATAVEGALFYRDARLVSLNELGGEPRRFGVDADEFHTSNATRARLWPLTMTATSTHDTKRGEDVRARIGVLAQVPELWAESVARWNALAPPPDASTALFLWQNIFGVWPVGGAVTGSLHDRLHRYAEQAIREAGSLTSWQNPDTDFEVAVHRWLDAVLNDPVAGELSGLVTRLRPHAESDALGQKLLALTVPGIPDVYQGTELWEDTLADPDNRRPVDYAARRAALKSLRHPKMRVVSAALRLRRARPDTFLHGGYHPVPATGSAADHVVAFQRGDDVLVAVTRWTVRLGETGWGDTGIPLPAGNWADRLTGHRWAGPTPAAELFADLPVVLLARDGFT